ncbi:MAG: CRTAC1 family protein [Nitrospirales bacterium]|nr:CRTAC1 family protein [Nitrospirales bacterium]
MSVTASFLRRHASRVVALLLIVTLYGLARLPTLPDAERAVLSARFHFTRVLLPVPAGRLFRSVRPVHPHLQHISAWISAVGAAVALNDLDGDGLPNDVCYVDTRTDQVIVAPVPGTPQRYSPFRINPEPLPYDSSTMAPMGCLPGDLNEDGLTDLLIYYWGRTPVAFLRQEASVPSLTGDSYVRRELMPGGERWYTNAATLADLDGDGHADLIIGNYFPDDARILDANGDGHEQMQDSMSRAYNGGRNRLLLWTGGTAGANPTVEFTEAVGVLDEQVAHGWTLAVGAADLDGDLLPEIYFANDFGPDRLLHNRSKPGQLRFVGLQGKKTLGTPNSKVLGHDSFKGMGIDYGDLNGDGLLDLYVSNITDIYALEESHFVFISTGKPDLMKEGLAPYVDRSESLGLSRSGWAWDVRFGDFDNDGVLEAVQATGFVKGTINRWPELHETAIGNDELLHNPRSWHRFQPGDDLSGHSHIPFFVRAADDRYYDLAEQIGLDDHHVSRGIATADVDGDGDLDFAVANQWEPSYFYRNGSPHAGAFLGLHLLLPLRSGEPAKTTVRRGHPEPDIKGRPAIGATAMVHLPDGRRLIAQADGGNGHSGKRSPDLHFGLGNVSSETEVQVDLHWRDAHGRIHQETRPFSPGWHTVLLAAN